MVCTNKFSKDEKQSPLEMKTTLRFHVTILRMVAIKKTNNNKSWEGYGQKETPTHHSGKNVDYSSCYGNQYGGLWKKLILDLPYGPNLPFLGIYPKDSLSKYHRATYT